MGENDTTYNQQSKADQEAAPDAQLEHAHVNQAGSDKHEEKTENGKRSGWLRRAVAAHQALNLAQRWEVAGTVITIIVGFLGLVLLDKQNSLMSRQTTLMDRQATMMQDENETNRAVQRAMIRYVGVQASRSMVGNNRRAINLKAIWENGGITDAVDVVTHVSFGEMKGGPSTEQFIGGHGHPPRTIAIGPHARLDSAGLFMRESLIFGSDLPSDLRQYIKSPAELNQNIFVFGWLVYRDVFPGSKPHVTGFCQQLTAVGVQEDGAGFQLVWADYGTRYNCRDEGCEGYEEIVKLLPPK